MPPEVGRCKSVQSYPRIPGPILEYRDLAPKASIHFATADNNGPWQSSAGHRSRFLALATYFQICCAG